MIPVVAFIGHHNSGKTSIIARLIPILIDRGYRVGAVKHAPSLENLDSADTDSARLQEAGAEQTLVVGADVCSMVWEPEPDEPIEVMIERLFVGFDLVLVEGYKHGPFPKVEVFRNAATIGADPLAGEIDVIAVITGERAILPDGVSLLSPRRLDEVADFIELRFLT